MWVWAVVAGVIAAGGLGRLFFGRDNVPPMERHFRALEALRDLAEQPRPAAAEHVAPREPSTDHVRILANPPADARAHRRAPARRAARTPAGRTTRTTRSRSRSGRAAKAGSGVPLPSIERPTIEIRPSSTRAPDGIPGASRPDASRALEAPAVVEARPARGATTSRSARASRFIHDRVAAFSSPAAAAAIGAGTVVVVIAAVALAGLGDHGGARAAPSKTPTPSSVRRPAAAPTTTTSPTPTTVAPARVARVVSRSTGGATVSVHSPFRMTLHATGTCWVEITDPTGRSLFTGTQRSGQDQLIPSRGPIVVRLGYTPAITIAVDGVDLDLSGLAQTTSINFQST